MTDELTERSVKATESAVFATWMGVVASFVVGMCALDQTQKQFKQTIEENLKSQLEAKTQFEALLSEQKRFNEESAKHWRRESQERSLPFLTFKFWNGSTPFVRYTNGKIGYSSDPPKDTSGRFPVLVNAGFGAVIQPNVFVIFKAINDGMPRELQERDWIIEAMPCPAHAIMPFDEVYTPWIPQRILQDTGRKIISLNGTVSISCTGFLGMCTEYDIEARPIYDGANQRVEFAISNLRQGPCQPSGFLDNLELEQLPHEDEFAAPPPRRIR